MSDADEKLRALAEAVKALPSVQWDSYAPENDALAASGAWMAYRAACSPEAVLSLLDRLAAVEAQNAHLRAEVRAYQTVKAGWRGEKEVAIEAEIRVRAELGQARQALQRVADGRYAVIYDVLHDLEDPKSRTVEIIARLDRLAAGPVGVPAEQPETVWLVQHGNDPLHHDRYSGGRYWPYVEIYTSWGEALERSDELRILGQPSMFEEGTVRPRGASKQ